MADVVDAAKDVVVKVAVVDAATGGNVTAGGLVVKTQPTATEAVAAEETDSVPSALKFW